MKEHELYASLLLLGFKKPEGFLANTYQWQLLKRPYQVELWKSGQFMIWSWAEYKYLYSESTGALDVFNFMKDRGII